MITELCEAGCARPRLSSHGVHNQYLTPISAKENLSYGATGGRLYLVEGGTRPDHHQAAIGRTEGVTHGVHARGCERERRNPCKPLLAEITRQRICY